MRAKVVLALLAASLTFAGELFGGDSEIAPLEWSRRLASSEIARRGNTLFKDGAPKARWDYTSGLFAHSLRELGVASGDKEFTRFSSGIVSTYIDEKGGIATYKAVDYNIDMIAPGRVVLALYEETKDARFKKAAQTLCEQLANQPRTSDGGFWHKQRYPWQMWLDGLYMASPFLAHYGKIFNEPAAFDEVVRQITLMDRHSYDAKTGLHYHGWDEKREQTWANPQTGTSPCFWGRSIGWYAMAIVDSLDNLPPTHPGQERVREILQRLAKGITVYQDRESGLWWQVIDQGGREGNYLETSASAMLVYSLAKGVNRGYLDRDTYQTAISRGYQGLIRDCTRTGEAGQLHLTRNCEVAGLGYTSSSGRPRDGSFEYYISEPVIENDLKGVGPFILAGIEVNRLERIPGWADVPSILAAIIPPTFPAKDFLITEFGARPGADVTTEIRKAIDACHAAGGGRVVIPSGEWLTGAIHLKSNINLHVSQGATLKFTTESSAYPLVFTRWEGMECMNHSALIYAHGQKNIAVTGGGTLDGQASTDTWWSWNNKEKGEMRLQVPARNRLNEMVEKGVPVEQRVFGEGSFLRPNFIQFIRCENILIEGVTLLRSPMWQIHPVLSNNITVRKVNLISHGTNNDGCNPESCRNVLIEDCLFDTGDDCIAIKSGRNNDGRRVNVPSENIVIRRCTMKDGHGGVVLGSEISGSVRNVFVEDCVMDSPNLDRALRFKSNAIRGGVLENVFMRNVKIGRVAEAVLTIDLVYEEGAEGPHRPVVRNIHLENVHSSASPRVMWIRGFEGAVIEDIHIRDSIFEGLSVPEVVEHAGSITLERAALKPIHKVR